MKKVRLILIAILAATAGVVEGQYGLVGYWSFDEVESGAFEDLSGWRNHGTVYGAESVEGIKGRALYFDGNKDFASIGTELDSHSAALRNLGAGSISLWFRVDSIPLENGIAPILYYGGLQKCDFYDAANEGLIIEVGHSPIYRGSESLFFTIWANGCTVPSFCFDSNKPLETGKWYHFVAVVGQDYNTGYLNGEEMTNRRYNFGDPGYSQFFENAVKHEVMWLGKGHWDRTEQFFKGAIDEIRIYNRPLSEQEIAGLYSEGLVATKVTQHTKDNQDVMLYPNPVTRFLNYDIKTEGPVHYEVVFIDHSGKVLIREPGLPSSGSINIQSLNPGIYTLLFTSGRDNRIQKRLMVH